MRLANSKYDEVDIENWLYEHPESLHIDKWIGRQVIMPSGRLDLLGITFDKDYERMYEIIIVEIKKHGATAESLTQVCRYAKDIEIILEEYVDAGAGWTNIRKYIVSNNYNRVDKKILYEADALDIQIIGYKARLELEVTGVWHWTAEYKEEQYEMYKKLGNSQIFDDIRNGELLKEVRGE